MLEWRVRETGRYRLYQKVETNRPKKGENNHLCLTISKREVRVGGLLLDFYRFYPVLCCRDGVACFSLLRYRCFS